MGCLHNGDPWYKKTVDVPAGRGPWDSWEDAAIHALQWEGYANLENWGCGDAFRRLELYNGSGYRIGGVKNFTCHKQGNRAGTFDGIFHGSMQDTTPRNSSPYLYNGTPYYQKGVSLEDHSFYPDAVDDNVGVMFFLKVLEEITQERLFAAPEFAIALSATAVALEPGALDVLKSLGNQVSVPEEEVTRMFKLQISESSGSLPQFWAACDFRKPSNQPRFHVFDRIAQTVTSHLCAHGEASKSAAHDGMAVRFSNMPGSDRSSLGIYRCAEPYGGKHGLSCRIDGIEPTNSNARQRDIVIHSASYVSPAFAARYGRVGCSDGCFALSEDDASTIVDQLTGGSLLIAFS